MILAYHQSKHAEDELAEAFQTIPFIGTQPDNVVAGLAALGYQAFWFENATVERLLEMLAANWPVIVFLQAQDLPHGRAGLHAVVVIGIENQTVICLDPSLEKEWRPELSSFIQIWGKLGYQGMVIWK
jgi:ABC-type bacteriocin/lantibiotic exporter with double-glycine peptidase domain